MNANVFSLQDIKKQVQRLPQEQIALLCIRLAKFNKENKEFLTYLLFEAANEQAFIENLKGEIGLMFSRLPAASQDALKGIRIILRMIGKYTKFIASKQAELELTLNFCSNYIQYIGKRNFNKPMQLIFTLQVTKMKTLMGKLHEDLQFDYKESYDLILSEAEKKFPGFRKQPFLL